MVVKACLNRQKISEVPTVLHPDGRDRPPHLRSFRDGWRHLRFLLLSLPALALPDSRRCISWPGHRPDVRIDSGTDCRRPGRLRRAHHAPWFSLRAHGLSNALVLGLRALLWLAARPSALRHASCQGVRLLQCRTRARFGSDTRSYWTGTEPLVGLAVVCTRFRTARHRLHDALCSVGPDDHDGGRPDDLRQLLPRRAEHGWPG